MANRFSLNTYTSLFYIDDCNPKQKNYKCKSCGGATVELEELNDLKSKLKVIWENKPKPTLLFDQRPVTLETSLKRVAYLMSRNDVYKKDIVFLGDDDLTSICLAMANNNCKITVLDADERLIDYINQVALKYNLNVDAFVLNVMNIIPDKWHGKFDVLMTDPTPQKIPFTVFTNAAIDLLKENGVLYTSIYSSAMSKNMDLQRIITNMNLYITEMIPAFTHYQYIYELYSEEDIKLFNKYNVLFDENCICFTETLFRLEKNSETKKLHIKFTAEDMMGKATKRVMEDKEKEVAVNNEYLENVRNNMKKTMKDIIER